MYERFTDRARGVMQLANRAAERQNSEFISPLHILLGLVESVKKSGLEQEDQLLNVWQLVLKAEERDFLNDLQDAINQEIERSSDEGTSPKAKQLIDSASEFARICAFNFVDRLCLFMGLLIHGEQAKARGEEPSSAYLLLERFFGGYKFFHKMLSYALLTYTQIESERKSEIAQQIQSLCNLSAGGDRTIEFGLPQFPQGDSEEVPRFEDLEDAPAADPDSGPVFGDDEIHVALTYGEAEGLFDPNGTIRPGVPGYTQMMGRLNEMRRPSVPPEMSLAIRAAVKEAVQAVSPWHIRNPVGAVSSFDSYSVQGGERVVLVTDNPLVSVIIISGS